MKKSFLGVTLGILAIIIVGALVFATSKDKNNEEPATATSQVNNGPNSDSNKTDSQTENTQTAPATASSSVEIKDYAYNPATITVKKGTKVTWTNQDTMKHDITPDDESSDFAASQLLGKGETYSYTFNKTGTYNYHCSPHPYMKATVVVTE